MDDALCIISCDAPAEIFKLPASAGESCKSAEGFPTPVTSPLSPPKPPRTRVKQYVWHNSAIKEVCMYIRIVNPGEIRKEEGNSSCSVMRRPNNSEINSFNHISRTTSGMCTPKNVVVKGKEELKFKSQEETNCQNNSDVIISSVTLASPNSDVTVRVREENRLVAKKRYAQKRSLVLSKGSFKSSLRLHSQTFVFITWILSLIISEGEGLFNVKAHEHKSTVGNSLESRSFDCSTVLYNLREFLATITGIIEELCFCINKGMNLDNNMQLIGYARILRSTKRDEEVFYSLNLKHSSKLARLNSTTRSHDYSTRFPETLTQNILARKRSHTYIFPSADFYASKVYYFNRYTINLELCDNFKVIFDIVCLYIFTFCRSWAFCNLATFLVEISADIYTLVYFSSELILLMFKNHDKYQSYILAGLGHIEKAKFENRSIFVHNRSYWREWRPLVTPWSAGIKEGTEPWKCEKRAFLSHVLYLHHAPGV